MVFLLQLGRSGKEFQDALRLNPNLEEAPHAYAWVLSTMGRNAEAVAEAQRAVEGVPFSASANLALGFVYDLAGRLDEVQRQIEKTIEVEPSAPRCYRFLGAVYQSLRLHDQAVEAVARELTLAKASAGTVEAMREACRTGC